MKDQAGSLSQAVSIFVTDRSSQGSVRSEAPARKPEERRGPDRAKNVARLKRG
jgi:hypothetical protein